MGRPDAEPPPKYPSVFVLTRGPELRPPFCNWTDRTPEPGRTRPQIETPEPRFLTTIGKRYAL